MYEEDSDHGGGTCRAATAEAGAVADKQERQEVGSLAGRADVKRKEELGVWWERGGSHSFEMKLQERTVTNSRMQTTVDVFGDFYSLDGVIHYCNAPD